MAEGRCNCASITVSIPELPKESVICYWYATHSSHSPFTLLTAHSSNCRRAGSTPGSLIYVMNKSEVTFTDPKHNLKSYDDGDTKTGNHIIRQFCGKCGW